jgi:cell division protein FtsW
METDKKLFYLISLAIFIGIVFSLSLSTFTVEFFGYKEYHFFIRQLIVGFASIFIIWLLSQANPDSWFKPVGFVIFIGFFLLMFGMHFLPESMVTSVGGAKRWIKFGSFSLAPVEFFKVGFVFFLAWSFSRRLSFDPNKTLRDDLLVLLPYIAVFVAVVFLIAVMQNDLGQVVVLGLTFLIMSLFAGTSFRFFSYAIIAVIVLFSIFIATSEHRVLRVKSWWAGTQDFVLSFMPSFVENALRVKDAPEPYQIYHSLNAIKNGGLFGLGLGNGEFKLGYLSEVHTDFVLAGIAEEFGFLGILGICVMMLFIIFRLFKIANRSRNKMHYLFCIGIALLISFSFLMNAYGVASITPIKGIAVPFLSYGGSSLLALSFALGLVLMISKKTRGI